MHTWPAPVLGPAEVEALLLCMCASAGARQAVTPVTRRANEAVNTTTAPADTATALAGPAGINASTAPVAKKVSKGKKGQTNSTLDLSHAAGGLNHTDAANSSVLPPVIPTASNSSINNTTKQPDGPVEGDIPGANFTTGPAPGVTKEPADGKCFWQQQHHQQHQAV